jgi:transcriptional regulator with XRE-family HTH domain
MYINSQRRPTQGARQPRNQAGDWLCQLREERGLSQRELADKVGAEYYSFISQLEHGRGRIPLDRYAAFAQALGVDKREFFRVLTSYYQPITQRCPF